MSEMERDSRVDTAWKAASREEPPVALDDAIRAAARKAVDAQPRRARDKHWWYPYAAAATVAVIAVGLLQVTPPEEVNPMTTKRLEAKSNNPQIRPRATKATYKMNLPRLLKRMDNSERSRHPTSHSKCSNRSSQNLARCLKKKPSVCSIR